MSFVEHWGSSATPSYHRNCTPNLCTLPYWIIHHIKRTFIEILAKIRKFEANWANTVSRGFLGGQTKIFKQLWSKWPRCIFLWQNSCCQTYQWPKKLTFMKIRPKLVENRQNIPWGCFFGRSTKIFTKCFPTLMCTFFRTKVLLLSQK